MKTSACRDGTLKKTTKLDGNDTTTLSYHPYICAILPLLTQIHNVFVSCVQRVVEDSSVWGEFLSSATIKARA